MTLPPRSPSSLFQNNKKPASELTNLIERDHNNESLFQVGAAVFVSSHSRNSSLSSIESGYCSTVSVSETQEYYDGSDYFHDIHKLQHLDLQEDEYLEPLKTPNAAVSITRQSTFHHWLSRIPRADSAALQFALRMSLLLTVSGLFVLVQTPDFTWPDGMWVLVSVLFVSWFPSLDAASVVEKIFQRLIGTFVGALLGLSCGFASLWLFPSRTLQAAFLGSCMLVVNFFIIFLAGQCKVGGVKVIRKYAYATILCVLTFCICMLPFGGAGKNKWLRGVMRVVNVVIGCLLGAIGAILVSPKSTASVLNDKTARQVKLCGEAAEAVLAMAADHFAGNVHVQALADELVSAPLETTVRWSLRRVNSGNLSEPSLAVSKSADVALQKFEDAMEDWKACKALFPLTSFDPFFHLRFHEDSYTAKTALNRAIARTLARSMRIQTTVVMLDGMVRHDTEYKLSRGDLRLLRIIGSLIQNVLAVPLDVASSNEAAIALLDELEKVKTRISVLSRAVEQQDEVNKRADMELQFREKVISWECTMDVDDEVGRCIPTFASDSSHNTRFFLQLVEHLILRTLGLYQAWKQVHVHVSKVNDDGTLQSWLKSDSDASQLNAVPKPGDSLRSLIGM